MDSYDAIEGAVKDYWQLNYPQDVVAFFWQKYSWDDTWERCEELVECHGSDDYENMTFLSDFCEGQTEVKDIVIIPLREVTSFYYKRKIEKHESKPVTNYVRGIEAARTAIIKLPAADVRPVVRGKWEHGREIARTMLVNETLAIEYEDWHCSACGAVVEDYEFPRYKFCPNCGADMREPPKEE